MLPDRLFHDRLQRNISSKIDHIKTIIFQKDLHDILPNIMDIPLHRRQDHLSLLLLNLSARLHGLLHDSKRRLRSLRTHQKLREEHRSGLESLSDLVESRDHVRVDEFERIRILQGKSRRIRRRLGHSLYDTLL